ncbi:MAG: HNH endonuclease [Ignavibacteriales bacterium]|nr:HNH endonuclease [Ignavibacteriales bacterium]
MPKISLARPWNPETEKLLIGLWDSHDPAQIAEAVNLWHKNYARSKGRIWWQGTSDAGVMYRAAKLGLITTQKSSLFHRRVKKLRARAHYINPKLRCAVLERDGQKCLLCGALENLETDHIIPVTDGGKSEIENLQTLCRGCHRTHKGTLHVDFRRPFIKEHCKACHLDHYKNI